MCTYHVHRSTTGGAIIIPLFLMIILVLYVEKQSCQEFKRLPKVTHFSNEFKADTWL